MSNTVIGTVSWFNKTKGFGYIKPKTGPSVYAHFSDVVATGFRTLDVGQQVEFTICSTEKGQKAENIVPI